MKAFIQILTGLLAASLLAACGGGGGGGSNEGGSFTPSDLRVTIDPLPASITPSSVVPVSVRVENNNGSFVADGTVVTLAVQPSDLALVSAFIAPPALGASTTTTTRGGVAQFRLHTRGVGNITLQATARGQTGGSTTASRAVTIVAGAGNDQRITIQTQNLNLPRNPTNATQPISSPFVSRTDIVFRRLDGTVISAEDGVNVSVQGGIGSCTFSTLDDPETTDINEVEVQLGSGPVNVNSGVAIIFVRSRSQPGTCTIVASGTDPETGEVVSASLTFTIAGGVAAVPTAIFIQAPTDPLYVQGSGGVGTVIVTASVLDGNGQPVPNPGAGINNVRVEIVSGPGGGERLNAVDAAGVTVSGTAINIRSAGGIVSFNLISGNRTGPVVIRVTADRADNNVDNGIQDPVTATRSVIISDGRLFDLDIANRNAIVVDGIGGTPEQPNPVYQLTITVIATDRDGNPVIPGTQIDFGIIDTPLTGNQFAISGNDGNPQEGGTLFTAPTGNFSLAGPGDTIVIFAEEIPGQRDMEAARTVQQITSINSLLTARPFNRNDTTGVIVDGGPIFPYVIGRAADGNITNSAITDEDGVATATLRYSQAQLGKPVIVWAQGSGIAANGQPNLVADVERLTFAGSGPATLTAQPSSVVANSTTSVLLCLRDSAGRGIPNAIISFTAAAPSNGQITVDGQTTPGTVATPTGANGCTTASLRSVNITNLGGTVTFTAGGASTDVIIGPEGSLVLSLSPNALQVASEDIRAVSVSLRNGSGAPIANAAIGVTCTSSGGTLSASAGTTDASGSYTSIVTVQGFVTDADGAGPGAPVGATGSCIYRVVSNPTITATLNVRGSIGCTGVSPPPPGCPPTP